MRGGHFHIFWKLFAFAEVRGQRPRRAKTLEIVAGRGYSAIPDTQRKSALSFCFFQLFFATALGKPWVGRAARILYGVPVFAKRALRFFSYF